ncbi:Bug family tripartite tricarboxylate transporter substrate binding protein [Bradyrhizobium guangzhouense]|uniref:Bug family tripartite tricarboxylate transporter substrate binding protein n=1 Tax=Bradyrhizobium guangzhouense TaxID=1325095 RepID=UPI001009C763|nr:tripartite tricarboxylate transporter substrate-binding protein [Bradyrhizobium guangzhouense]RXH12444.1 tripartite tricarboxylate transporter substrate binding protein [Bradyrhizobium guangzhouense]
MSRRLLVLTAICATLMGAGAKAEKWPSRPLHVVVPFGAGTITDILPRVVLEKVSAQIGEPIVIENRPGAGATTGSSAVAKAEADGYTLLVNSSALTIAPALYSGIGYDAAHDFAAVTPLGIVPSVLLVSPAKGFRTVSDLIRAAKAKPGSLNFASAGVGTATHLSAIRFNNSAGIDSVHIPFKAAPEILGEMIAGRIDYFLAPIPVALPFVLEGKLAALAVNTPERLASLPDVPTLRESGLTEAEYPFWIGVFLPAKTPGAVVDRLAFETRRALVDQNVKEKLSGMGVEPMDMTPKVFDDFVRRQLGTDAELVRAAGLKPQ